MNSKEEIERAKNIFESEVRYEQTIYDNVNNSTQYKYDNHKILLNYIDQLELNNKKLIEKLEKRRKQNNKRYGASIDNDDIEEMYECSGKVKEDDYILEILKEEK